MGVSFYITGEGFDASIISGDGAESVAKNIMNQYSDINVSFAGYVVGDGATVFEGTIDMYKYKWGDPAIGEIRCHFNPDEITITQQQLFDYDPIPPNVPVT